jgi:hypothetical protein
METSDNALLCDEEYCFRCQLQVNESGRAALGPGVSIRTGGAKSDFLYLCTVAYTCLQFRLTSRWKTNWMKRHIASWAATKVSDELYS